MSNTKERDMCTKKISIKELIKDNDMDSLYKMSKDHQNSKKNNTIKYNDKEDQPVNNTSQNKTYYQLLKDPRWQELRLRVMDRDGFCCSHCYSKEKTLNVHHLIYKKNANPWDYDPSELLTLCEECHEKLTKSLSEINNIIRKSAISKIRFYAYYNVIRKINEITEDI